MPNDFSKTDGDFHDTGIDNMLMKEYYHKCRSIQKTADKFNTTGLVVKIAITKK